MQKMFNSKTAENLAKKYELSLSEITTTRKNNKVTIQNVKDANKSKKAKLKQNKTKKKKNKSKSKSPVKELIGYNVTLKIKPELDELFNETISNMRVFKQWIEDEHKLPSVRIISNSFKDEKVKVLDNKTLEISFYVDNKKMDEVEFIIDSINGGSLDDDGNYPVFTDHDGNIYLEKTNTPQYIWGYGYASLYDSLVSLKILNKTIDKVYN
jgi:hypothetical protein